MLAGLDRLVRQAELVAHLESMLFSRLLRWLPTKLLAVCHRSALLLSSPRSCAIFIRPNDPREHRIPRYLVRRAYHLVAERRQRLGRHHREQGLGGLGMGAAHLTPGAGLVGPHVASLPTDKQRHMHMFLSSSLSSRPGSRIEAD